VFRTSTLTIVVNVGIVDNHNGRKERVPFDGSTHRYKYRSFSQPLHLFSLSPALTKSTSVRMDTVDSLAGVWLTLVTDIVKVTMLPVPAGALSAAHRVCCVRCLRAMKRDGDHECAFTSESSKKCEYCTSQNGLCQPVKYSILT
jgi:hypothetical protein